MEILIGIILYVLVIAAFSQFGRFLKECDDEIPHMQSTQSDQRRHALHH